ncbi:hypothetical protein D8674_036039 [Pyrus ussuriensis x Pyrus communis]|uniref:Uncharacterized protein n=1 Tax=Pyrus ussuriensis x Pyrus communis TaxID=2448454 RepID=A0A5N5GFA1_9ROSA|nr:hypothetical protein D8674_036039 [Pyrus ussuriensis x Pyrus communis]
MCQASEDDLPLSLEVGRVLTALIRQVEEQIAQLHERRNEAVAVLGSMEDDQDSEDGSDSEDDPDWEYDLDSEDEDDQGSEDDPVRNGEERVRVAFVGRFSSKTLFRFSEFLMAFVFGSVHAVKEKTL